MHVTEERTRRPRGSRLLQVAAIAGIAPWISVSAWLVFDRTLRATGSEDTSTSDRWALMSVAIILFGFLLGSALALWIGRRSVATVAVGIIVTASVAVFLTGRLVSDYQERSDTDRCPPARPGETVAVDVGGWASPDYCVYYDDDGTPSGRDSVLAR